MPIYQAIILGLIQGITEWLPISSSGHLVIVQNWFKISQPLPLDLMLHFGTALVVIFIFRKIIWQLLKILFTWQIHDPKFKLIIYIILASIPTALIGLIFKDLIESLFSNVLMVGIALILTGSLLFLTRKTGDKKLTPAKSILIGLAQGIAIIPGISRSGSTIGTGLILGVDRKTATTFSFLIFLPAILGASILEINHLAQADWLPILIATLTAMLVSYLVINWLLKLIQHNKFWYFSFYCWFVGLIIVLVNII
jgi:undecaprenyl-diphosphatase